MKTKEKAFDAVAESRVWREETSRMLDAMDLPDRLAYLESLRLAPVGGAAVAGGVDTAAAVVREETP